MSPNVFNSLLSKRLADVQYNYYKNETFCLGMIILSLICSSNIQNCYNRESKKFDNEYFDMLKSEMSSKKSENPLEKNFFKFVIKYMLNSDEKIILSPKKSLHLLSKLIKKLATEGEENITKDYDSLLKGKNERIFSNKNILNKEKLINKNTIDMNEELQRQSQVLEDEEKSRLLIC